MEDNKDGKKMKNTEPQREGKKKAMRLHSGDPFCEILILAYMQHTCADISHHEALHIFMWTWLLL